MRADQIFQVILVAAEIAEVGSMFQREIQRLDRVIKTDEGSWHGNAPRRAQNGERIGRSTQADIPDHKFAGMILQSVA